MSRVLVMGASGNVGRQILSQLPEKCAQFRALMRNPHAARLSPEIEVVRGDLTLPKSLMKAWRASMRCSWCGRRRQAQWLRFEAHRGARKAHRTPLISAQNGTPLLPGWATQSSRGLHAQIERLIEASGLEWTLLRPGMFTSPALLSWAPQIRRGDVVRWPLVAAPTAPIDERDIAAAAVRALCEDGHSERSTS